MKKQNEEIVIPAVKFLDKEGKEITLDTVLSKEDYWMSKSRKKENWIVAHRGVEKIAKAGGIKPQINTTFKLDVERDYKNGMDTEVVATMTCQAWKVTETGTVVGNTEMCVHDSDRVFYSTGEASRQNTGSRGGSYMRIMAEKRAYDRGVLQHLGLNGEVNIYSEDEADGFSEEKNKPLDDIIVKLSPILNEILNCTNKDQLDLVGKKIREEKYDEEELEYLRVVWARQNSKFTIIF